MGEGTELRDGCIAAKPDLQDSVTLTALSGAEHQEFHVTIRPGSSETPAATVARLAAVLRAKQATIIRQEIFGAARIEPETMRALRDAIGPLQWPVLWVEGAATDGSPLAGIHTMAVADTPVEAITVNGRVVANSFTDGGARHVVLAGLRPDDGGQPEPMQAHQVFEKLESALQQSGMTCADLMRMWLFLDDILAWYTPFNKVRTEFYQQRSVPRAMLPASTGIGLRNPAGVALVAGAWAARGLNGAFTAQGIPSPLQGPPQAYGSRFARAIELVSGGLRRVLISGTASITKDGRSAHQGDIRGQVGLTMNVVHEILASREMSFADVTRVTAYIKHPHDAPVFDAWLADHGLRAWPVLIVTPATICRGELLFEIEVDAVSYVADGSRPTSRATSLEPMEPMARDGGGSLTRKCRKTKLATPTGFEPVLRSFPRNMRFS
jgi:enamine deaminase RidA (YjgF/YER057c/UK114 family)